MAIYKIEEGDFLKIKDEEIFILKKEKFDGFNEEILGLGNIETKPQKIDALSAIFDLEGFTNFCNQREPEWSVSIFLNKFLKWIFSQIKEYQIIKKFDRILSLYGTTFFI